MANPSYDNLMGNLSGVRGAPYSSVDALQSISLLHTAVEKLPATSALKKLAVNENKYLFLAAESIEAYPLVKERFGDDFSAAVDLASALKAIDKEQVGKQVLVNILEDRNKGIQGAHKSIKERATARLGGEPSAFS